MSAGIVITPGLAEAAISRSEPGARPSSDPITPAPPHRLAHRVEKRAERVRALLAIAGMAVAFLAVSAQLVRLASNSEPVERLSMNAPIATAFARPDIVDRNGRLMAGDIVMPSIVADPSLVLDPGEVADKLSGVLPDLDRQRVGEVLADKEKRFAWLRRGVSPAQAQAAHELGLPGVGFRSELRRAYPLGRLAGHVLGYVDIDNKGLSGIERHLDTRKKVEPVHGTSLSARPAARLSLDVAVQFAVEDELKRAMERYNAKAASGLIMDVRSGEIVAAVSLPGLDPVAVDERFDKARHDRLAGGVYELGSIFKALTIAMVLDGDWAVTPETVLDVRQPLDVEGYRISDDHPAGRPLSVAEIFLKSSNVGAGLIALGAGQPEQKAFLEKLGLTQPMKTEAGAIAAPVLPARWGDAETVTISYGHGIAVAPLQFAAAAAPLVNGGRRVQPTFLAQNGVDREAGERVISEATSRAIREMMAGNVMSDEGTGRRARVEGITVGGKTGTAEIPGRDGYREKAVIASFLGSFPMENPRYLTLVSLFEPQGTKETGGHITAGRNAAPTTARIIERILPLIDLEAR